MKPSHNFVRPLVSLGLLGGLLLSLDAHAALDEVRFGAPSWPGVTVKTHVASQLLTVMGYHPTAENLSTSAIINSLATGDLDVYLAAWYPTQKPAIETLVDQGKLDKAAANITDAVNGLAVPKYVWDAGVHKVSDLYDYSDKFQSVIYGIAAGSPMSEKIESKIQSDYKDLGSWKLQNSSTAAMLSQVAHKTEGDQWVVFHAWKPHWMNVSYDLRFLKDEDGSPIADVQSTVWTITSATVKQDDPNLYRFFQQFTINSEIQSKWIYEYSHEKKPPESVARQWITHHMPTIEQWLDGVETRDGQNAFKAVSSRFQ